MTLSPALLDYLDHQIAAGLAPEQVRRILDEALQRWGAETSAAEIIDYLYERLRAEATSSAAASEVLRAVLARSLLVAEQSELPAEMDADIQQQLFRTAAPQALLPTFSATAVPQGRDHPHFESYSVDPDWEKAGPVLSRPVWLAREQELIWASHPHDSAARRRVILWRAVARAAHLDLTALTELQDYQNMQLLEADVLAELDDLADIMQQMAAGINDLRNLARVKEPHA
jgi:hypothetical protein